MCGLNGIFAYSAAAGAPNRFELVRTRDHMAARGPDGAGEWWSADKRLGLGHRRLAIIDLSDRASQPMTSECGRYVIVFNGEIYNYLDLRQELQSQGFLFRTTSDTETLLHLYARDGADMVQRLRGMFAFAIWDCDAKTICLARDPYGIKPLYYSDTRGTVRFASQVKALIAGGGIDDARDPAGIVGFYLFGSVPEPLTTYHHIKAIPAGHVMYIDAAGPSVPRAYHSIAAAFSPRPQRARDSPHSSPDCQKAGPAAWLPATRRRLPT